MCGIVGFTGEIDNKAEVLKAMSDTIEHRGPDGEGFYIEDGIALGHRRLAILDLEGGTQPMTSADGNMTVVFNGEIYNYIELRQELEKKGHTFHTDHSDTEVLLHGYSEWGEEILLRKLRGMFAFAIWNQKKRKLFCARDPFGIKPLYYYETKKETFMFASEIKSFLLHPQFQKKFNESQLEMYLTYQYSPREETFFKGVKKLAAGHYMVVSLEEQQNIMIQQYWEAEFQQDKRIRQCKKFRQSKWNKSKKDKEKLKKELQQAVQDSIEAHKISDVEVGSFLSSGIDSSYITYMANVDQTFTAGFTNERYDESIYAKEFSDVIGVKNQTYRISPEEYWESIPKIQYYMDEPLADASSVALYFLNQEAAKHVKVCLSGEGADELFGGYNTYKDAFVMHWYDCIPEWIRGIIGGVAEKLPARKGVNFLVRRKKNLENRFIGETLIFTEKQKKSIMKNYIGANKSDSISKQYMKRNRKQSIVSRMQYTDIKLWLVGDILLKADKMSMANSLELRVPYLDSKVFEIARKIPLEYRVNKTQTKILFREIAGSYLPEKIAEKKKLGFPVPMRDWLREEKYAKMVRQEFNSEVAKKFFHIKQIQKLLEAHISGKQDCWRQIWCIYVFILWYKEYFVKR